MTDSNPTPGPWTFHSRTDGDKNDGSITHTVREGQVYCVAKAPQYQTSERWAADAALICDARKIATERDRLKQQVVELVAASKNMLALAGPYFTDEPQLLAIAEMENAIAYSRNR